MFRGENEVRWGDWRGGRGGDVSWWWAAGEASMSEIDDDYVVCTSYMIAQGIPISTASMCDGA